ncbi:RHS repeat-associated core domain-containing protein [Massilia sp. B-10]|nr:RHS repeat-associated core domain-containing protein [Massilia sp. B-10]
MSAAKNGATVSSYLYNGIGQRVRQIASTQTANPFGILVYDESGQIIGEYDTSTGKATREYIYLGATLVGVLEDVLTGTAPNQVHVTNLIYAYTDHLNTPRILARSSDNKIVWRWDNGDPFGVIPPNENPSAAGQFKLNLRMPGQYFDSTTNLFYNYFRDYDPQLGRYIQSDPIGLAGGINTYAYVGSKPLNFVDPRGQFCVPCGILIVGLAITWYQVASKAHRNQSTLDDNGEYCPPSANGWKWPIFAESEEGTNSEGDGEEAKSGDNVEDVTKRPSRVRKGTEQSNWDNAEDGPNGGKNCPTCDKEVQSQPGTKYKDWDNDHTEPWRERDLTGKDRKGVLDEYNRDTRLRCVNCNRGDTR